MGIKGSKGGDTAARSEKNEHAASCEDREGRASWGWELCSGICWHRTIRDSHHDSRFALGSLAWHLGFSLLPPAIRNPQPAAFGTFRCSQQRRAPININIYCARFSIFYGCGVD